jgi:hypothetical protein
MPDSNPTENLPPKHDPFDAPDAEDEADTRERVLEGGQDAGDGDDEEVRRELGLEEDGDFPSHTAARRDRRGSPSGMCGKRGAQTVTTHGQQ